MRTTKLILIIGFMIFSCSNTYGQGLEIYLVKYNSRNFKKMHKKFDCIFCFELRKKDLNDSALIKQSDIDFFDWKNQRIKLKESGLNKIKSLKIPLTGLAVAISINKEPIYGFWLWNVLSSFGCDWVFTYPTKSFEINFGLPKGSSKGIDPRYNDKIEKYLTDNKLIK